MSWLKEVLESKQENEAPQRFFYWSALAVLSAVMGKRCFIDRFYYKLYPNIYVILVSEKSGLRKGVPVSMASSMLEEVGNTRVIAGHASIQGVVHEFSLQRTLENGRVLSDAQGIILAEEFSAFLVEDKSALKRLTTLHDTHAHENGYRDILKSSPTETLKNVCLTMLCASNEKLFEEVIKSVDMEGGFIARTFIVYESKRQNINSLMWKPKAQKSNKELAQYLRTLIEISGEFGLTTEVKHYYDAWYRDMCNTEHNDTTGSMERLGDQVLKVAMLLSLSKSNKLIIELDDLQEAIASCEECIKGGTAHVSMGGQPNDMAALIAKILQMMLRAENNIVKRTAMLKALWVDSITLDKAIDTLIDTGAVKSYRAQKKEDGIIYKMPLEIVEQYKNFKRNERVN